MKKFTTVWVLLLCVSTLCVAQTSSGNWAIGGSVQFSGSNNQNNGNEVKSTTYTFAPSVGYFVIDQLMVGAFVDMSISRQEDDNNTYKQSTFGIGPFLRYYKFTQNEQFAFFGEFGFDYGSGKSEQNGDDPTKSRTFGMYLAPGFTWFPTSHWGIDFQVNLLSFSSYDPDKDDDDDKVNSFNFGLNTFSPSLGVRYYFGK
ncbi:MAG TPA: outer membrane beta-barrel protein [Chryseolinea sp.]|nr:outer membrane beta-barrel protein [Chryseolinea sp.]